MQATTLLDTEKALAQLGDASALREMLALFHEALAHDIPAIGELLQAGDVVAANRLLHGLKGIVPIFCRAPLSDELKRMELLSKAAHNAKASEVSQAYADLRVSLEQLLAEVTATLAD